MPLERSQSPKHSRNRLRGALATLSEIKVRHRHWMKSSVSEEDEKAALHPHPVYAVRLNDFLEGKPLSSTFKKTGWMYFLRDRAKRLVCAEVSILAGKHKHARLSEGPFVNRLFQTIKKLENDKKFGRNSYDLRTIRLESLHSFYIWLKLDRDHEFFIPVSSGGQNIPKRAWLSRSEFTEAIRAESRQLREARARMSKLIETFQVSE